ncbi:uncharacterized protein LOC131227144 [Magnolia sinica]|uniref:uncharacterized protein LOC131227144 n=1 Tax=Magnolia sinica TaxID=86752 RepID=UPI00265A3FF3|nr:uncharacterized protein LOC131227144 [Magnolia sinica]XP_058078851.1 uncharacterized protein LOC131227144 [Magnolia sinica]
MERIVAVFVALLLAVAQISCGFSSPTTAPAFLWSSYHDGSSVNNVEDIINYQTISPKDLAKTVLSKGGWSNILCSGENVEQPVDIALVFIGRKLESSDITKNKHAERGLVDLLKVSFMSSNFSMAFPYVAVSEEKETMEKSLISAFTENCGDHLVNDIAFLESCSVEGDDLKKLTGLHSVHEYVGSRMQMKQKGQTGLVVFCSGGSQSSEGSDRTQSEGEIFSELITSLKQSGATYTVLYASDPYRLLRYPSQRALDRFLAEGTLGHDPANSTRCDGVCQIKSSLLEGVFVGIVLLIILLSGLCCMMGIDSPTRFETAQDS